MRKRDSKRRWKARCRIGRAIPGIVIVEHQLDRWFVFLLLNVNADFYVAGKRHGD